MSLGNNKMANIWKVKLVGSSKIQLSPQLLIEKLKNSTSRWQEVTQNEKNVKLTKDRSEKLVKTFQNKQFVFWRSVHRCQRNEEDSKDW